MFRSRLCYVGIVILGPGLIKIHAGKLLISIIYLNCMYIDIVFRHFMLKNWARFQSSNKKLKL